MEKLSRMQQKVYDYIVGFVAEYGYPPSVREICAALNFKSPSTAHFHIKNLEELGYLERQPLPKEFVVEFVGTICLCDEVFF